MQSTDNKIEKVIWQIGNVLRGKAEPTPELIISSAYMEVTKVENRLDDKSTFDEIMNTIDDQNICALIRDHVDETLWKEIDELLSKYDVSLIRQIPFAVKDDLWGTISTPSCISNLVLEIGGKEKVESVKELMFGTGTFLSACADHFPKAKICGMWLKPYDVGVTSIKMRLTRDRSRYDLQVGDIFRKSDVFDNIKADLCFSNAWGMSRKNVNLDETVLAELEKKYPGVSKVRNTDWIIAAKLAESLTDNGKAIVVMSNGNLLSTDTSTIRQTMINKGLIESVISLPSNLYETTSIPVTLVVLSKNKKDHVNFVDGSSFFKKGRRINVMTGEDIQRITNIIGKVTEKSVVWEYEDFEEFSYVLRPEYYLLDDLSIPNGVPFGSVVTSITRGAPLTAEKLDELSTQEKTDLSYLMLANIHDGIIDEDLPCLKEIPEKYKKYCIADKNLIVSKNGAPFKYAVAEIKDGQTILANGNLFVISLDDTKVDPYFVKAFFESPVGQSSFGAAEAGSTIPNISKEALLQIHIPLPTLERQKEIADAYLSKADEIKILRKRLEELKNDLAEITYLTMEDDE